MPTLIINFHHIMNIISAGTSFGIEALFSAYPKMFKSIAAKGSRPVVKNDLPGAGIIKAVSLADGIDADGSRVNNFLHAADGTDDLFTLKIVHNREDDRIITHKNFDIRKSLLISPRIADYRLDMIGSTNWLSASQGNRIQVSWPAFPYFN